VIFGHPVMRILANARIHTLNPNQPAAGALVIDDHAPLSGRLLAVGELDALQAEFGARAQIEDLGGAVVLPGLTDAHLHLRAYAHNLQKIDCFGASKQECLDKVAERAKGTPPDKWVLGHGWNQNEWPDGRFPSAADLDAAAPDHPAYLTATSLHAAWANSAALKAAGVTAETEDPPDGQFERDERGQPTGILFEAAMDVVADAIPTPTPEEDIQAMTIAQQKLLQMGLTGVHDFDRRSSFIALQTMRARGELSLRVLKHIPVERLEYAAGVGLRSGFGDDLLRIGGIKVFVDGALGPRTAAMLQPYEGEPENKGMLFVDREELFEYASRAALGGLSMTVHAIGDRANHEVLAAYEQLRAFESERGLPALRHRVEHAQILHPDDFEKFSRLGVIASVQPIHATSDMRMADRYWGERAQYAYAWQSLQEAGARLAFGSDAPVDTPNPFKGLHAAVTRQRADGSPGDGGWFPGQRLTLMEGLHGYTQGAAYAAGMEERLGMLAPGFLAELIVIDRDPFTCPPEELKDIEVRGTMLGGDWVWRA
jgi:hypothetical protein